VSPTSPLTPPQVIGRQSSVAGLPGTDDRRPTTDDLWKALEEVMDPEIPISLVDLGLIYDVRLEGGTAEVDLTFTATACPCMAFIRYDLEERLLREPGVDAVRIHEVWHPAWTKARITDRGREKLRELGVSM